MMAVLPTIVAIDMRRRRGLPPTAPHSGLGYAQKLLHMCFEVPETAVVSAFEQSMILYAEHGFKCVDVRRPGVVTSTQSDIYSAVTGAIGALKGAARANEPSCTT